MNNHEKGCALARLKYLSKSTLHRMHEKLIRAEEIPRYIADLDSRQVKRGQ